MTLSKLKLFVEYYRRRVGSTFLFVRTVKAYEVSKRRGEYCNSSKLKNIGYNGAGTQWVFGSCMQRPMVQRWSFITVWSVNGDSMRFQKPWNEEDPVSTRFYFSRGKINSINNSNICWKSWKLREPSYIDTIMPVSLAENCFALHCLDAKSPVSFALYVR